MEELNLKGYFFYPGSTDQIAGFLVSNSKSIILELFGRLNHVSNNKDLNDNEIILGISSKGENITLIKCVETSLQTNIPGFFISTYKIGYLLFGEHYNSIQEMIFKYCIIEYDDFNFWLDINGLKNSKYDKEKKEITINYRQPDNIRFRINEKWFGVIDFTYKGSTTKYKSEIEQISRVKLFPKEETGIYDIIHFISIFESFLYLNYFSFIPAKPVQFKTKLGNTVYLHQKITSDIKKYNTHNHRYMFFMQFNIFGIKFNSIIKKWFKLYGQAESSFKILIESLIDRGGVIEYNFLGLVQALENFHRRVIDNRKMSLLERLDDIVNKLPIKVKNVLLSDETNFMLNVKDNRNFYTHYSDRFENNAASIGQLFYTSEKLKIILITIILIELGISNRNVEKIILVKGATLFNHIINTSPYRNFVTKYI